MKWAENEPWIFLVRREGSENGGQFPPRKCSLSSTAVLGEKDLEDSVAPDISPGAFNLMPPGFSLLRDPWTHFSPPPPPFRACDLSYPGSLSVLSECLPVSPQAPRGSGH